MSDPVCETELKFVIGPRAGRALRRHPAIAEAARTRLRATYFDTPGRCLLKDGLSLRVREADSRFVQTVKRGQGPGGIARDEWESEVPSRKPDLAALRSTPAGQALDGENQVLQPLFKTSVTRTSGLWRTDGDVVEVSLDEGEVRGGGRREPIRELELELKSGEVEALFRLAREFSKAAPLRLSYEAKSARGYRLLGREEPGAAGEARAHAGQTTGQAFQTIARAGLEQVASAARAFEQDPDAGALHKTRVALRRFRAALSLFKPLLLADPGYETVRTEARWLAKALDAGRDLDVFIETSLEPAEAQAGGEGLTAVRQRLQTARDGAYADARDAILSRRFCELLLDAAEWIEVGAWRKAAAEPQATLRDGLVDDFAVGALDRLRSRVVRRGKGLKGQTAEERHRLRIAGKKLRYAGELLGGVFDDAGGKRRARYLAAAKRLQDGLGVLNDIAVAESTAAHASVGDEAAAFAAGQLVGRRQAEAPELIKAAAKAFEALKDAKPFWR